MADMSEVIKQVEDFAKHKLHNKCTGHDWWHRDRVRKCALSIANQEGADPEVVEIAALLHDIGDWKFCEGYELGAEEAQHLLKSLAVDQNIIDTVCDITKQVAYKGAGTVEPALSLEAKVVQDADRLDALGAMGIARTFAYGGLKEHPIYDPEIKPGYHSSFAAYQNGGKTSINHFYEKLLLLKEKMNTPTGKKMAEERHSFLEGFLKQFYSEWNGEEL